jgi:hypothetical protein
VEEYLDQKRHFAEDEMEEKGQFTDEQVEQQRRFAEERDQGEQKYDHKRRFPEEKMDGDRHSVKEPVNGYLDIFGEGKLYSSAKCVGRNNFVSEKGFCGVDLLETTDLVTTLPSFRQEISSFSSRKLLLLLFCDELMISTSALWGQPTYHPYMRILTSRKASQRSFGNFEFVDALSRGDG